MTEDQGCGIVIGLTIIGGIFFGFEGAIAGLGIGILFVSVLSFLSGKL